MSDRYKTSKAETDFELGSNDSVLGNKLGIKDPVEMDELKTQLLRQLYDSIFNTQFAPQRLLVSDILTWHHQWLGNIYLWAGDERSSNVSKDGFVFCAANQIPSQLQIFQRKCLNAYTPTTDQPQESLIDALAITHVEFILIHPFRDGNGRIARLLMDVMAAQNGYAPLDYSPLITSNRKSYFTAIQAGHLHDYTPMKKLVKTILATATKRSD